MRFLKKVAIFEELITSQPSLRFGFLDKYTHIRGYHGCRPIDIDSYYHNGIIPINKEDALCDIITRLKSDYITVEKIEMLFNKAWDDLRKYDKVVWFTISEEELIDYCGHYLIYGSEFIMDIAVDLRSHYLLKLHGIPTVFCCDIPITNFDEKTLKDIERNFIEKDFSGGFRVLGNIAPNEIIKHFHPEVIKNWHEHGSEYRYKQERTL